MSKIKISIIIPMFNSGSFIIEMIDSILKQTFFNWELIIVDDISTDATFHKVSEHTKNEDRIKLIQRNRLPKGAQTCRNIGFENSIGEYVVFFDADDLISANCLKQRVLFMDSNPELDFGVFPAHTFRDRKNINEIEGQRIYAKQQQKDDFSSLLKGEVPFAVWTNIYRKNSIIKINWDEKVQVFQDFYFNFLSINHNLKFRYASNSEYDYFYRIEASLNSITNNFIKKEKVLSTIYLFEKVLDSLKLRSDFLERKKQLYCFCFIYLEKLIFGGNIENLNVYFQFLKENYPLKFDSLNKLRRNVLFFKNIKLKKISYFLSMILVFRSDKHLQILVKKIKVW